ncbi:MAG: hypothetical protein LBR43_03520 [Spiroplasmataceae bacterium]|jgi:Zn finger protein HypA/HybF involved in hydrogenase expression|nr:hypothetical protein [Spiroplasmataceae bacterium]
MLAILLTISTIFNLFLLGITTILWFIRCQNCSKDKEFRRAFNSSCEKCAKDKPKIIKKQEKITL